MPGFVVFGFLFFVTIMVTIDRFIIIMTLEDGRDGQPP
jgi:hypothetical protein